MEIIKQNLLGKEYYIIDKSTVFAHLEGYYVTTYHEAHGFEFEEEEVETIHYYNYTLNTKVIKDISLNFKPYLTNTDKKGFIYRFEIKIDNFMFNLIIEDDSKLEDILLDKLNKEILSREVFNFDTMQAEYDKKVSTCYDNFDNSLLDTRNEIARLEAKLSKIIEVKQKITTQDNI